MELPKLTKALSAAASDPRVRGLLTYLGKRDNLGGVATAQEVVQAVQRFRLTAGARAPAAAFAGSYGEAGDNGTVAYMLAAAHGQVYMQASGERRESPTAPQPQPPPAAARCLRAFHHALRCALHDHALCVHSHMHAYPHRTWPGGAGASPHAVCCVASGNLPQVRARSCARHA